MTDLDERIMRALREHADGPVDTGRLVTAAVHGGRARRRRRRAVAGAALGMVAVLGAGMALPTPSAAPPTPAVTPGPSVVPPRAPGVPGAAARPDLVGTDPGVLHFGVDPAVAQPVAWRSAERVESMRLDLGGGRQAMVLLAADPQAVEMGDPSQTRDVVVGQRSPVSEEQGQGRRPLDPAARFNGLARRLDGVTDGWVVRWRPTPDLYARLATLGDSTAEVQRVVAGLRFDEARRCAAPIRLTALPRGARITECDVAVRELPWPSEHNLAMTRPRPSAPAGPVNRTTVVLSVRLAGSATLPVRLDRSTTMTTGPEPPVDRTVGGWPVQDMRDFWSVLGVPHTLISMGWEKRWERSPTDAEVDTVIGGLRVADDLDEPATWE